MYIVFCAYNQFSVNCKPDIILNYLLCLPFTIYYHNFYTIIKGL